MISLSFRTRDIVTLIIFVVLASAGMFIGEARGRQFSPMPVLALAICIASVLVDAYYNAKRIEREKQLAALEKATPLASLREKLIRDLIAARRELTKARVEAEEIAAANAISQLDRESTVALLRNATRPSDRDLWVERAIGFLFGIAGSIIASYVYSALHLGSNA